MLFPEPRRRYRGMLPQLEQLRMADQVEAQHLVAFAVVRPAGDLNQATLPLNTPERPVLPRSVRSSYLS